MKRPPFEEALNDVSARMGLSPVELLQEAMRLRIQERVEIDPPDEYCEEQCILAELEAGKQR